MQYRKKPVVIEAVQYFYCDGKDEVKNFVNDGSLGYDDFKSNTTLTH
jgi:hypothetical protein